MEILFCEDDLEPVFQAEKQPDKPSRPAAEKRVPAPRPAAQKPPLQEESLFSGLEEEMGLEPVFAPAPVSAPAAGRKKRTSAPESSAAQEDFGARAEKLFGTSPQARPAEDLQPEMPSAMQDVQDAQADAKAPAAADSGGPRIIRDAGDVRAMALESLAEAPEALEPPSPDEPEPFERKRSRRTKSSGAGAPKQKKSLLARAVDALSRREYSRRDLARKLMEKLEEGETRDDVEAVLTRLEGMKLLSDERYAEMKARISASRMGDRKIHMELRRSGVDEETARAAVETIEEPEAVRAWRIWSRRWSEPPENWKEREKMIRYLAYRGFSMSSILKVLSGEAAPEDEEF